MRQQYDPFEYNWRESLVTPLCGWEWYSKHGHDVTQADIDSQAISLSFNGRNLPAVSQDRKDRGLVKDLVKSYRKE